LKTGKSTYKLKNPKIDSIDMESAPKAKALLKTPSGAFCALHLMTRPFVQKPRISRQWFALASHEEARGID